MSPLLQTILYLLVLASACAAATYRIKQRSPALRIFSVFLVLTLVAETVAVCFDLRFHNNMPVYHVYAPLMLIVLALYFFQIAGALRKHGVGWLILMISVIAIIANTVYLQPVKQWNSNAILLCGLCIIGMCLFYFRKLFLEAGTRSPFTNIHFWLAFILMFFWSSTFFLWTLLQVFLIKEMYNTLDCLYLVIWLMNMIAYTAITITFLYFKPLK